jgi:hypothetical protein
MNVSASHISDIDPQERRKAAEISSPGENWKLHFLLCPCKETFQVSLANPPNGVDVRCKYVRGENTGQRNRRISPEEQSYLVKYPRRLHSRQHNK